VGPLEKCPGVGYCGATSWLVLVIFVGPPEVCHSAEQRFTELQHDGRQPQLPRQGWLCLSSSPVEGGNCCCCSYIKEVKALSTQGFDVWGGVF